MALENLSTCIGAYDCDSTGFDTLSQKLKDKTLYGNDLSIVGATAPTYVTSGGKEMIDLNNLYYFEGLNQLRAGCSFVLVGVVGAVSLADGVLSAVATASRSGNAGNFDAVPYDNAATNWAIGQTNGAKFVSFYGTQPRIYDNSGQALVSVAAFSSGAINILSGAFVPSGAQIQGATKNEATKAYNFTQAYLSQVEGSHLRLGYLRTTAGALAAGNYIYAKRLYIFNGNVFDHPNWVAQRDAEIALWGIV